MHYFTINTEHDEHIGFLVMLPDDGGEQDAPHGQFAIKLTENSNCLPFQAALTKWANNTELRWAIEGDFVQLYDENGENIGTIRQQNLKIGGKNFILNDLTGVM